MALCSLWLVTFHFPFWILILSFCGHKRNRGLGHWTECCAVQNCNTHTQAQAGLFFIPEKKMFIITWLIPLKWTDCVNYETRTEQDMHCVCICICIGQVKLSFNELTFASTVRRFLVSTHSSSRPTTKSALYDACNLRAFARLYKFHAQFCCSEIGACSLHKEMQQQQDHPHHRTTIANVIATITR